MTLTTIVPPPQRLIDTLRRTQLIPLPALKEMVERFRGQPALCTADLLEYLAREELLTPYQLEEVRNGRADQLVFQGFRLLDKIGSGGMGHVYLAVHPTTKAQVALKVLHSDMTDDLTARARFEREGMAAHGLMHPNIVRVLEFQCDTNTTTPYLVMEFVPGVSLQAVVALTGSLTAEAVAYVGYQVAAGLTHAWQAKLVHRDIKPANLLLAKTGVVKILDLGIVRLVEESGLTVAGRHGKAILGTLDYLSPEQAIDSSCVDCRADVYSLGATLYFLLAGQPPYNSGTQTVRLMAKHTQAVTPIHHLRPDVSVQFSSVISKMLERQPSNRYQSPQEVQEALEQHTGVSDTYFFELFENIRLAKAGEPLLRTSNHPSKTHKPLSSTIEASPIAEESIRSVFEERDESQAATIPTPTNRLQRTLPVTKPLPFIVSMGENPSIDGKQQPKAKQLTPALWKNWVFLTLVIIGLVTLLNCVFLLWLYKAKESATSIPERTPTTRAVKPVVTVMANGAGDFLTLREAFAEAVPNQLIELHSDTWTENLCLGKINSPGVKVLGKSPSGKPTIWKSESASSTTRPICKISDVRGVTFEYVCFDGEEQVEELVSLSQTTATFQNVEFRNFKTRAIQIERSSHHEQLDFQKCQFSTSVKAESALQLADVPTGNLKLSIVESRFDGPMDYGLRICAPLHVLAVERCRFHEVKEAVVLQSSLWTDPFTMSFKRNVIASSHCGVRWVLLPTVVGTRAEFTGNVFENVKHAFFANQIPTPWITPGVPEPAYEARLEAVSAGISKMYPIGTNNIVLNGTTIAGVPGGGATSVPGPALSKDKTNDRQWLRLRPASFTDPEKAKEWGVHE